MTAGSLPKAREAGRVLMEGKDYVMQDGDVVGCRPPRVGVNVEAVTRGPQGGLDGSAQHGLT
jgi:hypothetical protein